MRNCWGKWDEMGASPHVEFWICYCYPYFSCVLKQIKFNVQINKQIIRCGSQYYDNMIIFDTKGFFKPSEKGELELDFALKHVTTT